MVAVEECTAGRKQTLRAIAHLYVVGAVPSLSAVVSVNDPFVLAFVKMLDVL